MTVSDILRTACEAQTYASMGNAAPVERLDGYLDSVQHFESGFTMPLRSALHWDVFDAAGEGSDIETIPVQVWDA